MSNYLPKIKLLLLFSLLICLGEVSYAQNFTEETLKKIRNHQFSEVDSILETQSKTNLVYELAFYNKLISSNGIIKDVLPLKHMQKSYEEPLVIALSKLNKGLYGMLYQYNNLYAAFLELHKALEIAEELKNEPLVCEILKALLLNFYDKKFTTIPKYGYKKYIKKYEQYIYDSVEREIYEFIRIHIKMIYLSDNNYLQDDELENLSFLSKHMSNDYFRGRVLLSLGIYYENFLKDYEHSLSYYDQAKIIFSNQSYEIYFERWLSTLLNEASSLKEKKLYTEVFAKIEIFQNHCLDYSGKQIDWLKMYEFLYLKESYADLNDNKNYEFYNIKYKELKNKFDQVKQDMSIENRLVDFDVENKEKEIMKLETIQSIVLPILAIIALIAIALFYYFKKYKSKSKNLESAQSETLEKIEELKSIVIKNHIVLKDKTKVYISDLMYIKSEDHYLRIFTNDTKSAFVRGKLSQIKEELPPNFIQSHRSYIINSNFIKQINNNHIILLDKTEIPLSRSHKNNFKDKP